MPIELIDTLKQKNNGSFGLVDSNDIIGGFYQVDYIIDRDNIPIVRRKERMLCSVKHDIDDISRIYQLVNGIQNVNWIEFKVGSDFSGDFNDLLNVPNFQLKTEPTLKTVSKNISEAINENYDGVNANKTNITKIEKTVIDINSKIDGITVDVDSHIVASKTPPTDNKVLWLNTSKNYNDSSVNINNPIIVELMDIIKSMKVRIETLETKVEYLITNGGGIPTPPIDSNSILLEDGSYILLEDGFKMLLETKTPIVPTDSNNILLEDGFKMLLEDGFKMLLETNNPIVPTDKNNLLLEDGKNLLLEDSGQILLEN